MPSCKLCYHLRHHMVEHRTTDEFGRVIGSLNPTGVHNARTHKIGGSSMASRSKNCSRNVTSLPAHPDCKSKKILDHSAIIHCAHQQDSCCTVCSSNGLIQDFGLQQLHYTEHHTIAMPIEQSLQSSRSPVELVSNTILFSGCTHKHI